MSKDVKTTNSFRAEIVANLMSVLERKPNYAYVSVSELLNEAHINQEQVEFMELFVHNLST